MPHLNKSIHKRMRRLGRMDCAEVRLRLAQKLRIGRERVSLALHDSQCDKLSWMDSWNPARICSASLRDAVAQADVDTAEAILASYLASRVDPSFYLSLNESIEVAHAYPGLFPGRVAHITDEAERLVAHNMRIFAYPEVDGGAQMSWRADLVHGVESGLEHWSRIPHLDFSKVGDSKIVWEPNRHQHLVTLALAFRLSHSERYAEECFAQWEDWERHNPYLCGINWASSLELAFRTWSWIWMIHLLTGSRAMTGKRLGKMIGALRLHADFITRNLSTYYSPNTHLLGEGFILFVLGLLFPEFRSSKTYLETGRKILLEEMTKQVRRDGSHAEQSTYYHGYATNFFLCAAILADRNNCAFPAQYRTALEHMCDFMMHTAWPRGSHPMVGDADGGRLMPFGVREPNDHRSTLSTAAVYFEREDFRYRAEQVSEETLWLLGPKAADRFVTLAPKPPFQTSKVFPQSGAVVMRNNWRCDANMLFFDAGPQGLDNSCGHGHADALSIVCSAQGIDWLIDPGTFVYTASQRWRDFFRSTGAHNTLVIDGNGQAESLGCFNWHEVCHGRLDRWVTLPNLDYAKGVHDAYQRLAEPVVHQRRVVFIKPDRWFLLDDLRGEGSHLLEFLFHFHPAVQLHVETHSCWAVSNHHRFLVVSDPRVSLDVLQGEENSLQGWYSRDYGQCESAQVLRGAVRGSVPDRFPWILWPGAPEKTHLRHILGQSSAWTLEADGEIDYFIFSAAGANEQAATDADFVFLRQERDGRMKRMTLLDGSWLNLQRIPEFRSHGRIEEFDLVRHDDLLEVHMRPALPFTLALDGVSTVRLNGNEVRFERTDGKIAYQEGN